MPRKKEQTRREMKLTGLSADSTDVYSAYQDSEYSNTRQTIVIGRNSQIHIPESSKVAILHDARM